MNLFETPFSTCTVQRYPKVHDHTLMPFDHADRMLLDRLSEATHSSQDSIKKILIVNDEFGALTCALANHAAICHWSDSLLSQIATRKNLESNNINNGVTFTGSTEQLPTDAPDIILIKLPKNLNYFRHQLKLLAHYYPGTGIWLGVMQKFITPQVKKITEQFWEHINAGRGEKKARVIQAQLQSNKQPAKPSQPLDLFNDATGYSVSVASIDNSSTIELSNLPNVFSASSIDIGSSFFIEHFPDLTGCQSIGDLGCGNGLLSLVASVRHQDVKIIGYDESYQAIASANRSAKLSQCHNIEFLVSNCASDAPAEIHDAILCNPPFHQQRRVTTDTAHYMFQQAFRLLKPQGCLWVIANRHLGYHHTLRKIFGNATVLASNPRFVILHSQKN